MLSETDEAPTAVLDAAPESEDSASPSESQPVADQAAPVESTPDDAPPEGDDAAPVTDTAPPPPTEPPAPIPVRIRNFGPKGQDDSGVLRHHDGSLAVPPEHAERTINLLARGREAEVVLMPKIQQLSQRIEEVETTYNEAAERGNILWDFWQKLADEPDEVQQAFWSDFKANRPRFEIAADRQLLAREREFLTKQRAPKPEQLEAQQTAQFEEARTAFSTEVQKRRAQFPELNDAQIKELTDDLWDLRDAYLVIAPETIPAQQIVKGQPAIRGNVFEPLLLKYAKRMTPAPRVPSALSSTNQKVVQSATAPAKLPQATPPSPTVANPSGQPRDQRSGRFKSKEEYDEYMAGKYGV